MSKSQLRLYNTLSQRVEDFAPSDGSTVRMYTCGPTVYNPAHLGNFRTFLFEDLLRRVLRHICGLNVHQVMNLTDVDDKIINRAAEKGIRIEELTAPVIERFHDDRRYLRIEDAESYPRATGYIPQMVGLVERLVQRGLAYQADDGTVYFAINRFAGYGKLSRLDTRELKSGARVSQDDYSKENAQDFALWKAAKDEDERVGAAWDSPWGRGRPGWHLECSAMAMDELGETIDLHCGGVDLVFPHHEDEIAQSEGATGKPFSRFWCHGAFLLTEGAKMAKRVGNVWTVGDLREQKVSGQAVRHFVFSTHYRKELNLVPEAIEAAMTAVARLGEFEVRLKDARGGTPALAQAAVRAEEEMRNALLDDLNAPEAQAALFTFVREGNAELDRGGEDPAALAEARRVFGLFASVLDTVKPVSRLSLRPEGSAADGILAGSVAEALEGLGVESDRARWAAERAVMRMQARERRDFSAADALRKELGDAGFDIEDTASGPVIKPR